MISVYAYKGCDTCRKALKWLNERGIPHEVKAIRETPPTVAELKAALAAFGGDLRPLRRGSAGRPGGAWQGSSSCSCSACWESMWVSSSRRAGRWHVPWWVLWPGAAMLTNWRQITLASQCSLLLRHRRAGVLEALTAG